MKTYEITKMALLELEDITDYTYEQWGLQGLKKYIGGLNKTFEDIGTGKTIKRLYNKNYPNLFVTKYGRHFIYYIDRKPANIPLIIAILHERMNIDNRLAGRTV